MSVIARKRRVHCGLLSAHGILVLRFRLRFVGLACVRRLREPFGSPLVCRFTSLSRMH
ncbi:hypothetical protein FAGKG844_80036 [Frankia sp. AgKG'84/4]